LSLGQLTIGRRPGHHLAVARSGVALPAPAAARRDHRDII
jgi:hypothetical protein